ncbi:MAG: (d)CMP kinase [Rhodospirillaceae bacterium]|jgi:cytidylate kinase|nr:(d)CMP kinase [Rhodospirillaceae bacterium]
MIIAVDGLTAAGKGTLARKLAEHYGFHYLDTGVLYRAVALEVLRAGKNPTDPDAAMVAVRKLDLIDFNDPVLRYEQIGNAASKIGEIFVVRSALLSFQQNYAIKEPGVVLDGRDIGTVVCQNADVKFFIIASLERRVARRLKELFSNGITAIKERVCQEMNERDLRDIERRIAPLTPAADAVVINTSELNIKEVFDIAVQIISEKFNDEYH